MGLVDGDAYGLDILSVYRYGSQSLRHENEKLAAHRIQWLGVRAADLARYEAIPPMISLLERGYSLDIHLDTLIPITKHDEKKVSPSRAASGCHRFSRANLSAGHGNVATPKKHFARGMEVLSVR